MQDHDRSRKTTLIDRIFNSCPQYDPKLDKDAVSLLSIVLVPFVLGWRWLLYISSVLKKVVPLLIRIVLSPWALKVKLWNLAWNYDSEIKPRAESVFFCLMIAGQSFIWAIVLSLPQWMSYSIDYPALPLIAQTLTFFLGLSLYGIPLADTLSEICWRFGYQWRPSNEVKNCTHTRRSHEPCFYCSRRARLENHDYPASALKYAEEHSTHNGQDIRGQDIRCTSCRHDAWEFWAATCMISIVLSLFVLVSGHQTDLPVAAKILNTRKAITVAAILFMWALPLVAGVLRKSVQLAREIANRARLKERIEKAAIALLQSFILALRYITEGWAEAQEKVTRSQKNHSGGEE